VPPVRKHPAPRGDQDRGWKTLARGLARKAPHGAAAPEPPAPRVAPPPPPPPAGAPAIVQPYEFILPPLFPYQDALVRNPAWELVIVSATQIGKTFACACWLLAIAFEHPGTLNWWCAPTRRQARNGYWRIKSFAQSAGLLLRGKAGYSDTDMMLRLWNGAVIECRSFRRPDYLQGDSIYGLVVDEAGLLTQSARALISSRRSALLGPARYIGNPGASGSTFWELHDQAVRMKVDPEWAGYWDWMEWTWETRYNALVHPLQKLRYKRFIDNERLTLAPFDFARLYYASWAIPEKSIFGASLAKMEKDGKLLERDPRPHPGHPYLTAWDIGVTSDYTVGVPLCLQCWTVTDYHRERPGDTAGLAARMVAYSTHWNDSQMVIERNGLGMTIFNDAARLYRKVQGWQTDNVNKRVAVFEVLNRFTNQTGLTLFKDPTMLKELTNYESQQNPKTQAWTFGAPTGGKDDIVMATVIAVGAATSGATAYIEMMKRQLAKQKAQQEKMA